jgi:hypothetical protein
VAVVEVAAQLEVAATLRWMRQRQRRGQRLTLIVIVIWISLSLRLISAQWQSQQPLLDHHHHHHHQQHQQHQQHRQNISRGEQQR